jgi:hypothetical protein
MQNAPSLFPRALVPELWSLSLDDPFEATRRLLRLQAAGFDAVRELGEQAATLGRKAVEDWILVMDAFDPSRRES